jgi:hypothetical protein
MHLNRKNLTVFVSAALAVGVVAGPQVGTAVAKKTYKFTMVGQGKPSGGIDDIRSKLSASKPFGKGKQTGKVVLPNSFYTWKFKGGTIKAQATGTLNGPIVTGKWKVTKGSKGKFKGATGGGTFKGSLTTAKFTFKGKIRF